MTSRRGFYSFFAVLCVLTLLAGPGTVHAVVRCEAVHDHRTGLEVITPQLSAYQRQGVEYGLNYTSFKHLLRAYEKIREGRIEGDNIYEQFLTALQIRLNVQEAQLAAIPASGPLVITSNHPFGGLDGIILVALLKRIRPDVKFLAAEMLTVVPELRGAIIPVSFAKGPEGSAARQAAFEAAQAHAAAGGALIVFPAGGVAQARGFLGLGKAVDTPWKAGAARILQATGATQVSAYFPGQNSLLFQTLGRIPGVRPLFLGREIVNKEDTDVTVRFAAPQRPKWNEDGVTPEEITRSLRERTEALAGSEQNL